MPQKKIQINGTEIISILAKHASKEIPELKEYDGKEGLVALISDEDGFRAEFKPEANQ